MIDLEGFEMRHSDCEYRHEDDTCGCERCSWYGQDVECEPDDCDCYSPCEIDEDYEYYEADEDEEDENEGDEWD